MSGHQCTRKLPQEKADAASLIGLTFHGRYRRSHTAASCPQLRFQAVSSVGTGDPTPGVRARVDFRLSSPSVSFPFGLWRTRSPAPSGTMPAEPVAEARRTMKGVCGSRNMESAQPSQEPARGGALGTMSSLPTASRGTRGERRTAGEGLMHSPCAPAGPAGSARACQAAPGSPPRGPRAGQWGTSRPRPVTS